MLKTHTALCAALSLTLSVAAQECDPIARHDADGSGGVSLAELTAAPGRHARNPERAVYLAEDFAQADTDGSGELDATECATLRTLAQARRFAAIDADGDGLVTTSELAAQHQARQQTRQQTRHQTRQQARRGAVKAGPAADQPPPAEDQVPPQQRHAERFRAADANGDGALSREEFQTLTPPRHRRGPGPGGCRGEQVAN